MRGLRPRAAIVMLSVLVALGSPCAAETPRAELPILDQHISRDRMLFAKGGGGAAFYGGINTRDLSNVWIEVIRTGNGKRSIKALAETWIDGSSRQHSLSVLKLQMDYNDAITAKAYVPMLNKWYDHEPFVLESGILDKATLAIPHARLSVRAKAINTKLMRTAVPHVSSYVYDALKVAYERLGELETAMGGVPVLRTINMPVLRVPEPDMGGLHGLETPGGFALGGFSSRGKDKYRNDLYGSAERETPPERSVEEFIDLSSLTPAAIEQLQQKEKDAAKAVDFAESLCKELLAGRCE